MKELIKELAEAILDQTGYDGTHEFSGEFLGYDVFVLYIADIQEGKRERTTGYIPAEIVNLYIEDAVVTKNDHETDIQVLLQDEINKLIEYGYEI